MASISRRRAKVDPNPFRLATRIAGLPEPKNPEQAGLHTFLFGAVYSTAQAAEYGYNARDVHPERWKRTVAEIKRLASAMGSSSTRQEDRHWLPGFHANNALLRVDVGFERVLRYVTGNRHGNIDLLQCLGEKYQFPSRLLATWRDVRKRVNVLKHRNPLQLRQERIPYRQLLRAVEHLVEAVEWALGHEPKGGA